jgi:hypothetical protein
VVGGGGGDGMFVGPIYMCNAKTDDIILGICTPSNPNYYIKKQFSLAAKSY